MYVYFGQLTQTASINTKTVKNFFFRISIWSDVTAWMLGQGLTGRQWHRWNPWPLTQRDLTPQESSALQQQSWHNVRLKWAHCSESSLNSTRRWARWSHPGNIGEAKSRFYRNSISKVFAELIIFFFKINNLKNLWFSVISYYKWNCRSEITGITQAPGSRSAVPQGGQECPRNKHCFSNYG